MSAIAAAAIASRALHVIVSTRYAPVRDFIAPNAVVEASSPARPWVLRTLFPTWPCPALAMTNPRSRFGSASLSIGMIAADRWTTVRQPLAFGLACGAVEGMLDG